MNKKGFTLIEVLSVLVIIAILGGMAVVGTNTFFKTAEDRYYETVESNILLAGNDYFTDHREELPTEDNYSTVELSDLISNKYLEPVKDSSGGFCTNGLVYVYREKNKYKYEVCLIGCGSYSTSGGYCSEISTKSISVSAKKAGTNESYDVTKSYSKTAYSNGKDIEVTMNMDSKYSVHSYKIYDTKGNIIAYECTDLSGNSCTKIIDKSGTYRIVAQDSSNKVISMKYINVRIDKNGSNFTLTGNEKYTLSATECNGSGKINATINVIKGTFNEEYKSIEYKIDNGDYIEANNATINMELGSGHHTIEVAVTNFANNVRTATKVIDVSYYVNILYDDNTTATHEVIYRLPYNLPATKVAYGINNLEVRWYKDDVAIERTAIVQESCTHQVVGKISVPVQVIDFTGYCNSLTYNGEEQTLTTTPPEHITFIDNTASTAGPHTVKAHINSPQFIWQNGDVYDYEDKEFTCNIERVAGSFSCSDKTYNGSNQVACTCSGGTLSGTYQATNASSAAYAATCTPDNNHTIDNGITAVTKTWNMNKGTTSITCKSAQNWTGSAIESYSASSNCSSITNGSVTNAGTYTVTCNGDANREDSTCSFTVNRVAGSFSCSDKTYNGSNQVACTCSGGTLGGTYQATNASTSYSATCTPDDNHTIDGETSAVTKTWAMGKIAASLTCANKTYNGSAQNLYSNSEGCASVTNGSQTNAGSWTLTCVPDDNHTAPSTCSATMSQIPLTITANSQTIDFGNALATGPSQVTVSGLVTGDSLTGVTLTASTTVPTTTGTITPSAATTTNGIGNYDVTYNTGTLTINRITVSCNGGYYLKANTATCTQCPANYYCPAKSDYTSHPSSDQGKNACSSGYSSSAGSSSKTQCCKTESYCDGDKINGSCYTSSGNSGWAYTANAQWQCTRGQSTHCASGYMCGTTQRINAGSRCDCRASKSLSTRKVCQS